MGARGQWRLKPHPCLPGAVVTQVGVKTRKQQCVCVWGGDKGMGQFSLLRLQTQMRDRAVAAGSEEAGGVRTGRAGFREPEEAEGEGRGSSLPQGALRSLHQTGATRLVQSSVRLYPRSRKDCLQRPGPGSGEPPEPPNREAVRTGAQS